MQKDFSLIPAPRWISEVFFLSLPPSRCHNLSTERYISFANVNGPNRPIYIGKNQNPKNLGFFVVPFTLPEKPITFGVFGTKSACAKKPESHTCVLVSGAHARLISTFDRTRVVCITSRAAVGWFRWRSHTTWPKTRIIPARLERAFTLAKTSEISAEFQKITLRRWVFRFGFFGVFRGSCLATFNEKPECEKDSGFLMPV